MSPRLWLVRHAPPLAAQGLCYGRLNLPADAQATRDSARALADALPQRVLAWHSPLQRCEQLALALQRLRPDLILRVEPRLAELDFGCWEGWRWDAIPQAAFDAWLADFGAHRFGGRESVNELLGRVAAVRAEQSRQTGAAVWITHAGVIRALRLLAQGISRVDRAGQWPQQAPGYGEWLEPGG